jgi:hypothetical protein
MSTLAEWKSPSAPTNMAMPPAWPMCFSARSGRSQSPTTRPLYDAAWLIFWWPWFPQWQDIDVTAELERHWDQNGGLPPGLHHRLQACLVHIGLGAMAYNAYRRCWDDLARTASQVSGLI